MRERWGIRPQQARRSKINKQTTLLVEHLALTACKQTRGALLRETNRGPASSALERLQTRKKIGKNGIDRCRCTPSMNSLLRAAAPALEDDLLGGVGSVGAQLSWKSLEAMEPE